MTARSSVFEIWRGALERTRDWLERERAKGPHFWLKAFGVFFLINFSCFWWAVVTAFHSKLHGVKALEYTLLSFPVSFLGATFDVVSLAVTIWAISHALRSRSNVAFMAWLSVDVVKSFLASFWLLFVFVVSGWLVAQILPIDESLLDRAELYQDRVADMVVHPLRGDSVKNAYFGMVMGISAMLPTLAHGLMALWALATTVRRQALARSG